MLIFCSLLLVYGRTFVLRSRSVLCVITIMFIMHVCVYVYNYVLCSTLPDVWWLNDFFISNWYRQLCLPFLTDTKCVTLHFRNILLFRDFLPVVRTDRCNSWPCWPYIWTFDIDITSMVTCDRTVSILLNFSFVKLFMVDLTPDMGRRANRRRSATGRMWSFEEKESHWYSPELQPACRWMRRRAGVM